MTKNSPSEIISFPQQRDLEKILDFLSQSKIKEVKQLLQLLLSPKTFIFKIRSINQIVHGFCKVSAPEEGEIFLNKLINDYSFQPDVFTYTTLMSGYSQKSDYQECLRIMNEMKLKQIEPNQVSYNSLITAYCKALLPSEGEKILHELRAHGKITLDIVPFNALIHGYVTKKQPMEAYRIFQELNKTTIPPDIVTYRTLIYGLAPTHPKESEQVLYHWKIQSKEFQLNPKLCNHIIQGYCEVIGPEEGERFLNKLITEYSFQPGVIAYTTLMGGFSQQANYQECLRLMNEMKLKHIQPNIFSYTSLITAYSKALLPSEGEKILQYLLNQRKISLDIVSFNSLINGYVLNKQPMEAFRIFQELIDTSIPPDESTYKFLLSGLEPKHPKESEQVFQYWASQSDDFKPPLKVINQIIKEHCNESLPEIGERFLRKMMKSFSFQPDVVTYTTLMNGYADKSDYQACLRLREEMKSFKIKPNLITLTVLITAYCKAVLPAEGEKILHYFKSRGEIAFDIVPYTSLIIGYTIRKEPLEAYRIFQELIQTSLFPDEMTYDTLLSGLQHDHPKEYQEVLLHKKNQPNLLLNHQTNPLDSHLPQETLHQSVCTLCNQSRPLDGYTYMTNLISSGVTIPSVKTYSVLIQSFILHGDYTKVESLLEEMNQKQISPNLETYESIIQSFCKKDLPDVAIRYFWEMIEKNYTPSETCLLSIVDSYVLLNQPQIIERFLNELKQSLNPSCRRPTSSCYDKLIKLYTTALLPFDAERVLFEAQSLGIGNYWEIIHCFIQQGSPLEAERFIHKLMIEQNTFPELGDSRVTLTSAYNIFLFHCFKENFTDDLFRKFDEMKVTLMTSNPGEMPDGGLNVDSFKVMIRYYCKKLNPMMAEDLLNEMVRLSEFYPHLAPTPACYELLEFGYKHFIRKTNKANKTNEANANESNRIEES